MCDLNVQGTYRPWSGDQKDPEKVHGSDLVALHSQETIQSLEVKSSKTQVPLVKNSDKEFQHKKWRQGGRGRELMCLS